MSEQLVMRPREIRGVMLPVGSRGLLLPNAAVAEVIGYQEPEIEGESPDWLVGKIGWRGGRVPVLSLETALNQPETAKESKRVRIAVLNTLNANADLPYVGLLTLGISRLARITEESLTDDEDDVVESPLIARSVRFNNQPAWIPDMDALEELVLAAE